MFVLPMISLIKYALHSFCLWMRIYEPARVIGMKLFEPSYTGTLKSKLQKLFLEKYLDISFMVILNVHIWIINPHLNFWGTPWDVFNSIWLLIWIPLLVIYPIYVYMVIWMHRDDLESDEIMGRVGVFYEEQRFTIFHGATFNIREMGRRFSMVLAITVFKNLPYFQVASLAVYSFMTLWMIAKDNAFTSKKENIQHFATEFIVYACTWSSMTF